MYRSLLVVCVVGMSALGVHAQQASPPASSQLPPDIANIPAAIKTLNWKSVDMSAATPIERCRALLFLNHALDEINSAATGQADLMSSFIDAQQLGPDFASHTPPADPHPLTYDDAMKISVALLRGPQASSPFNSQLDGAPANQLAAYQNMYQSTCQRRWSEMAEARTQIRAMSSYLADTKKMQDFQTWAAVEVPRREQEYAKQHAQEMAAQAAAEAAAEANQQAKEQKARQTLQQRDMQISNQQMQQAFSAAEYQQQQSNQQSQSNSNNNNNNTGNNYYSGWYPGWYGAGTAWCNDAAYRGAAAAATENRMSGWHGTPAAGGRRR